MCEQDSRGLRGRVPARGGCWSRRESGSRRHVRPSAGTPPSTRRRRAFCLFVEGAIRRSGCLVCRRRGRRTRPDRILGLVALRVDGRGASSAACLERDGKIGELGERVVVERAEQRRLESGDVIVQGIDHQPERYVALELSGASVEHQPGAVLGAAAKLCQRPCLADPGSPARLTNQGSPVPTRLSPLSSSAISLRATGQRVRPLSSFAAHASCLSRVCCLSSGGSRGIGLATASHRGKASRLFRGGACERSCHPTGRQPQAALLPRIQLGRILSTRSPPREQPEQPLRCWVRA